MTSSNPVAPRPIREIAEQLGLRDEQVEPYGWFQGKLAFDLEPTLRDRPTGKYVAVTAINPTPLGEGKTIVAIGLAMALNRLGRPTVVTLRQPSLGPLFGMKGGGAGGGRATLLPAENINLHFTGDFHAVTAATNLLAALIDNHVGRRHEPQVVSDSLSWRRAVDICDRSLERITTGLAYADPSRQHAASFQLTPASEIMAILGLAIDLADLRQRLGRIVVGQTPTGQFVTAEDLRATGALTALLRDALRPNLVQTCEHTPALVHTGPFANIAHGNSSVLADRIAGRLAEYTVTECGFGSDCGAEKLFDIKCPIGDLRPDVAVLVCTARAVKCHSGQFDVRPGRPLPPALVEENLAALDAGAVNLEAHLDNLRQFGVPVVVAINRFPSDHASELREIDRRARAAGAVATAEVDVYAQGSAGGQRLAEAVVEASRMASHFQPLYGPAESLLEKLTKIATRVYGADGVDLDAVAAEQLERFAQVGFGGLPVCVAKTQYSLSHDARLLGRPRGFRLPIKEVRLAAGAGYLFALAGEIRTMPGLPSEPAAQRIDVTPDGRIVGI